MRYIAPVIFAICAANPALANPSEITKEVADAISAGVDLTTVAHFSDSSKAEIAELAELKGCDASLGAGSSKAIVYLEYTCPSEAGAATERKLELHFKGSKLQGVWLDLELPIGKPTTQSATLSSKPSKKSIGKDLVTAIKSGGDVSLGQLIPLTEFQKSRLLSLAKCKGRRWKDEDKRYSDISFTCGRLSSSLTATKVRILFDKDGLPIGVNLSNGTLISRPVQ